MVYGLKSENIKNHYQFFLPKRKGDGIFIPNDIASGQKHFLRSETF